jgi:homoserine kinase
MKIKIPASTANLGCGFDVLGGSLTLYLELEFQTNTSDTLITYIGDGSVPTSLSDNLITRTAQYISAVYKKPLPHFHLAIRNQIPLGRGLGSSGSAVVGGVLLANELCHLNMSKQEILDYCVLIEGHPDNVSASFIGGITASYLNRNIYEQHVLVDSVKEFNESDDSLPRLDSTLCTTIQIPMNKEIRAVVCIPKFELKTSLARSVLPDSYSRADVVYNLSRISVLVHSLSNPDFNVIRESMKDKIHQNFRQHLVPGLKEILELNPILYPGLLGVALSGAGPTVLALANDGFDSIGEAMVNMFKKNGQEADYMILDFEHEGACIFD